MHESAIGGAKMITTTSTASVRRPLFAFLVDWIKELIRNNIIAPGYEDEYGFHFGEPYQR
jgi:hypothetical protein